MPTGISGQTRDKKDGQNEEEDDAQVRIVIGTAEYLYQPVADHGNAGRAGDGSAGEADGIVAEITAPAAPSVHENFALQAQPPPE